MTAAITSALAALPLLLTVTDVAKLVKVHDRTVRRWIERGELAVLRAGGRVRIEREELLRFLRR